LYLLGKILHPSTPLGFAKLPKLKMVLQKVLGIVEEEKVTKAEAVNKVTAEITDIWEHHFCPRVIKGKDFPEQEIKADIAEEKKMIISDSKISEKIRLSLDKYDKLEYESRRVVRTSVFEEQEAKFVESLRKPLNILKAGCWRKVKSNGVKERVWRLSGEEVLQHSGILSWQEDLQHLRNQLTEDQPGTCKGGDIKQMKKDDRNLKRELGVLRAKEKEVTWEEKMNSKVNVDDEEDEETKSESDEEDCYKESKPKKKKKVDVMSFVSGTADRLNLSVRKKTMMAASTCNALGYPIESTNISTTSAWRHGHKNRKSVSEEVKKSFDPRKLWFLHWDGKTCKLRMDEKSNFVAIYVVSVDGSKVQKLLDVPKVVSGKAEDEFQHLIGVLKAWGIKKENIVGLVFDTTASNTGEWSGVCR
jgi:hypothetical protein